MTESQKDLNYRITDEVRAQIAFEVFRTTEANKTSHTGSYTSIGKKFGIHRTTVQHIALEFNVDRGHKPKDHFIPGYKAGVDGERNIARVNWTFNSDLKLVRVKRRESELVKEVHESMATLAQLS